MSRDHAVVGQLVDELATVRHEMGAGRLDHSGERSIRRDDRISAEHAPETFEAMDETGRRAHGI